MKVLLADGGGALAAACAGALRSWGHEVEVAQDGVEALRRARATRPDLVLARDRLERLGPLPLLAALRAGGGLERTAFVLVVPREDPHARDEARALGATGFLGAPLAVAELSRLVERLGGRGADAGAA